MVLKIKKILWHDLLGSILDLRIRRFVKMIPVAKILFPARYYTNLKNPQTTRFCMMTPIVSIKYWYLYQFCCVKISSTN
jgi:hypothetical protein